MASPEKDKRGPSPSLARGGKKPSKRSSKSAKVDKGDAKAAQVLEGMFPAPVRDQITAAGQLPAAVMAARIIEKADLSAHLTVIANRTKNEAHAAIDAATSLAELQDVLQVMADAEANALAEFQQAIGA